MRAAIWFFRCFAALMLLTAALPASAEAKRLALLIGVGQYRDSPGIPILEGRPPCLNP